VTLLAAVVGVAVIAAILVVTKRSPGNSNNAVGSTPTASAPGTSGTGTVSVPSGPITVLNMFPQTQLDIDGLRFTRVAATTDTKCSSAANGPFGAALTSAGCKRVVRATYVDASKKYVVTAGLAAMPTPLDATTADGAKHFGPDVWFTALDGPAGSGASSAAKTVGVGNDVVDDRFIVFALSCYSNGQNPTRNASEIQTLTGLSQSFSAEVEQQLAPRLTKSSG
jgi:hypothetical protein